jgi:hypothetical protein
VTDPFVLCFVILCFLFGDKFEPSFGFYRNSYRLQNYSKVLCRVLELLVKESLIIGNAWEKAREISSEWTEKA